MNPTRSPTQARFPPSTPGHSIDVLDQVRAYRRLPIVGDDYFSTKCWNENYAQQNDGTLIDGDTENGFVADPVDLVLSGPHFYVANPLYQTPIRVCQNTRAYERSI